MTPDSTRPDIEWIDPPQVVTGRRSTKYGAVREQLRARIAERGSTSLAAHLRTKFGPEYEVTTRKAEPVNGKPRCDTYARYIGGES